MAAREVALHAHQDGGPVRQRTQLPQLRAWPVASPRSRRLARAPGQRRTPRARPRLSLAPDRTQPPERSRNLSRACLRAHQPW